MQFVLCSSCAAPFLDGVLDNLVSQSVKRQPGLTDGDLSLFEPDRMANMIMVAGLSMKSEKWKYVSKYASTASSGWPVAWSIGQELYWTVLDLISCTAIIRSVLITNDTTCKRTGYSVKCDLP